MTRKSSDKSPGNTRPLSCSSRMPVLMIPAMSNCPTSMSR